MKIGIIREGKIPTDNRVALTPEQCNFFTNKFFTKNLSKPDRSSVTLEMENETDEESTIIFYNILGTNVLTEQKSLFKGLNSFDFDIKSLESGMYFIAVNSLSGQRKTMRLIKL